MSKDKSNLKSKGISITSYKVKRKVTQKDMEKILVKEVANKINVIIDNDGNNN